MKTIKNLYAFTLACFSIFFVLSCNSRHEKLTVTYYKEVNSLDDQHTTDFETIGYQYIDYDSVRFSDESWATYRLRFSPQNKLTEFVDNQGHTCATIAQASECFPQIIIYDYDDKGRLIRLMYPKPLQLDSIYQPHTGKDTYLAFRRQIEEMDSEHPDTSRFELTNIEYDEEGDVRKVSTSRGNRTVIEAPQGYKLTVSVRPCTYFWESDLWGGCYVFHTKIEPKAENLKDFKISRFVDFTPTMDAYCQNGNFVKVVWYPNPIYTLDKNSITCLPVKEGDFNLYTEKQEDGTLLEFAYHNGLLAYKQLISRYGTVLEKQTYSFLSDNEVQITTECLDYKTKTMQVKSTCIEKVNRIDDYHEGMNLSPRNERWSNYYDSL